MKYGLYDTKDDCWFGDDSGPKAFDDLLTARCAAQITEAQICGNDLGGRIVAREIPEQTWQVKDEIATRKSALKALQQIEGRVQ